MRGVLGRAVGCAAVTLLICACSGTPSSEVVEPTPIPFAMQLGVAAPGLASAVVIGARTDHIVFDEVGAYLCVLRRADDLASLRAGFNPRSTG